MTAALIPAIVGVGALFGLAAALALLIRAARIPGGAPAAAVAGGILAGVLLGPAVAWRAAPDLSWRYLRGNPEAQRALADERQEHQRELLAMQAGGAGTEAVSARARELRRDGDPAVRRAAEARQRELDARAWLALLVLSVALALAAWARTRRSSFARLAWPGRRPEAAQFALPGAAMSLMPALLAAAALRWGAGLELGPAIAVGGAFGAGSLLGPLRMRRRPRIGEAPDRLALFCLLVSALLMAGAALETAGGRPWALVLPAGAVGLGWLAGWAGPPGAQMRAVAREFLLVIGAPGAVAFGAGQIALAELGGSWRTIGAIAILGLLAGAGQLLGAWLGMVAMRGRRRPMATALAALCAGVGLMQALGALALLAMGVIEPWTTRGSAALAALLLSGLMIELTAAATLQTWRGVEKLSEEFAPEE